MELDREDDQEPPGSAGQQAIVDYKEAIAIPRDRNKWRSVGNARRMSDELVSSVFHAVFQILHRL